MMGSQEENTILLGPFFQVVMVGGGMNVCRFFLDKYYANNYLTAYLLSAIVHLAL